MSVVSAVEAWFNIPPPAYIKRIQTLPAFPVYKERSLSVPISPLTELVVGLSTIRHIEIFHVYWNPPIALVVRTACLTNGMNEVIVVGHGFGSTNRVISSAMVRITSANTCATRRSISVCPNPTTNIGSSLRARAPCGPHDGRTPGPGRRQRRDPEA